MPENNRCLVICLSASDKGLDKVPDRTEENDSIFIAVLKERSKVEKASLIRENFKVNEKIQELFNEKRRAAGAIIDIKSAEGVHHNIRNLIKGFRPDLVIVPEDRVGLGDADMDLRELVERESSEITNEIPVIITYSNSFNQG